MPTTAEEQLVTAERAVQQLSHIVQEGRDARLKLVRLGNCPYDSMEMREAWRAGWFESDREATA